MDDVSDNQMSEDEFSDDESTGNGSDDDNLFQTDVFKVEKELVMEFIVRMVCTVHYFPPQPLKNRIFVRFMWPLNPSVHFQLRDSQRIKEGCLEFYEEERIRIGQILRNRDGQINLSVETLRCYKSFKVYAFVRAHFIDDNWNHKGWVLRVQNLDECSLIEAVQKSIKLWGIGEKVLTVIFQGYRYNFEDFDDEIKSYMQSHKQLELDGKLLHGYCCANLLREMADAAHGGIDAINRKLKGFISIPMVDQYWSVDNFRLKKALDLKSMGEITREIVGDDDWLSDEEWKKVEQIHELVEKLFSAAKLILECKYPYGGTFLVGLNDLRESLKTAASSCCIFTNAIAEKMLLKLDKYLNNLFLALAIAAVMDPRCKMVYIEFLSSKCDYPQQPTVLESVCNLYDKYATTSTVDPRQENSETGSNEVEDSETEEEDDDEYYSTFYPLSSHLQDFQEFAHTTIRAPRSDIGSDLDQYLEEPVISWDDNFDLLAWWGSQSPNYPTLSKMARDILSIQFSVLDSVFYNEERSAEPELLNVLMCTRSWHVLCKCCKCFNR